MRAMPSFTSSTVPTSSTSSECRSAASISRSRISLISPGRSDVSDAMVGALRAPPARRARASGEMDTRRRTGPRGLQLVKIITSCEEGQERVAPAVTRAPYGAHGRARSRTVGARSRTVAHGRARSRTVATPTAGAVPTHAAVEPCRVEDQWLRRPIRLLPRIRVTRFPPTAGAKAGPARGTIRSLPCDPRFAVPHRAPRTAPRHRNRSTRSTVRSRARLLGRVRTSRCVVAARCDDEAKPSSRATSPTS